MQIVIPEKYFKKYNLVNKVYLSRWKNNSIWIMCDYEKDTVLNQLENLDLKDGRRLTSFIRLGMFEIKIKGNSIEMPDNLLDYIGSREPKLVEQEERLIICK